MGSPRKIKGWEEMAIDGMEEKRKRGNEGRGEKSADCSKSYSWLKPHFSLAFCY